jgi:cystathionine beta-lyase/cystathionine gamma-synthase
MLNHHGGRIDPHRAWFGHRGLKTLGLRLRQAQRGTQEISELLHTHPTMEWVRYPGASDHAQRELVGQTDGGPGAIL